VETSTEPSSARFTGLWRHHDFLKLWAGQTISLFGTLVGNLSLTFVAIIFLDATPIQVALLNAAKLAPGLVVGLFAGVWVDRLRRRPVMILMDIGRAITLGMIPLLAAFHHLTIGFLYAIVLIVSVLTVFFDVAYRSYLPSLVRREDLMEGNSKLQASASVSEFSGFGVAGVLVQLLSAPGAIAIDALSFLVSAFSLATIRHEEPRAIPAAEQQGTWREIGEGLRLVRDTPLFRTLAGVTGAWYFSRSIFGAVIMLFITRALGVSPALQGVIYSVGGVSSFFGAVLAERVTRRWGVGPTMFWMLLLTVVSCIFVPLASGPLVIVVVLLVLQQIFGDGAATLYEIDQMSVLQASTPDRLLGRMNASIRFIEWSTMLLGLLLGGVLGEVIGLRPTLFAAVGGQLLAPLWLALSPVRTLREHPGNS
jgi:Na+/melibiose symporter-like transporter